MNVTPHHAKMEETVLMVTINISAVAVRSMKETTVNKVTGYVMISLIIPFSQYDSLFYGI